MNSDDIGCAVCICLVVLLAILVIVIHFYQQEYKNGYVQALSDIEEKKPLKYQLIKQENGESIWVKK
jgi:hypothetical protein